MREGFFGDEVSEDQGEGRWGVSRARGGDENAAARGRATTERQQAGGLRKRGCQRAGDENAAARGDGGGRARGERARRGPWLEPCGKLAGSFRDDLGTVRGRFGGESGSVVLMAVEGEDRFSAGGGDKAIRAAIG